MGARPLWGASELKGEGRGGLSPPPAAGRPASLLGTARLRGLPQRLVPCSSLAIHNTHVHRHMRTWAYIHPHTHAHTHTDAARDEGRCRPHSAGQGQPPLHPLWAVRSRASRLCWAGGGLGTGQVTSSPGLPCFADLLPPGWPSVPTREGGRVPCLPNSGLPTRGETVPENSGHTRELLARSTPALLRTAVETSRGGQRGRWLTARPPPSAPPLPVRQPGPRFQA